MLVSLSQRFALSSPSVSQHSILTELLKLNIKTFCASLE